MGLFGKGTYYEDSVCLKNYRELHEAMNCFYKALELEEFGASKLEISKALELEEFGAGKIEISKTESFAHVKIKNFYGCKSKILKGFAPRENVFHSTGKSQRFSNTSQAWFNRAIALKNHGKLQEALKSFNKVLEIDPNNAEAWFNKGDILVDIYFLKGSIMANCY